MVRKKKYSYTTFTTINTMGNAPRSKNAASGQRRQLFFLLILILAASGGLNAQTEFPAGEFWSLDAGVGMSNIMVEGQSFQFIIDPKLWLSPAMMVGTKFGVNYSFEEEKSREEEIMFGPSSDILTFEGQVYLRWNFLRLGNPQNTVNVFTQAGLGILAAYRGDANPFDNVKKTRGSLMADGALGVTIPIGKRWHIEPLVRGGYPHIWGVSLTAGYKFPLPQKTRYVREAGATEYREIIKTIPPTEIIKVIRIHSVEFILFGPDIAHYNLGVDHDGQALNELVLNETAQFLRANPGYQVRLEGHANPVTTDPRETDELMALSTLRANTVAAELRRRGVAAEQIITAAFGGTRTVTSEHDNWNRNRRVELIILQVDTGTN